jgi:hypothetical protein
MSAFDLADARESLAYWEERSRRLPRHALRRRREARELARRWRARVAEHERALYGGGLLGALLMLVAERRLPEPARQARLTIRRWTVRALVATWVLMVGLTVAAFELLVALLRALN